MTEKEFKDLTELTDGCFVIYDKEIYFDKDENNYYTLLDLQTKDLKIFTTQDDMLDNYFINGETLRGQLNKITDW